MALKHSIPLLLDVLNEYSNDHEDPEGISDMIEEGYATLMDLASTCKFAKSAVSFLDSRLFSSEDGMEDPSLEAQVSPSPEYNALSNQEAVQDLFPDEQEDTSLGVNEALGSRARETTGWNSLLDDLEVGYSSLDTNCPERMQGGWTADLGQSLSLLDGAALSLDR
ncbi:hypothetical protein IMZ48_09060 [Candidatus Bathyarchaeota archaeon]|nr:hypothetical protein [Candidatus Bathyarchaeota archaeon]